MNIEVSTVDSSWNSIPLGELVDVLDNMRKPITKPDRVAGPYPYYGATGALDWVSAFLFDEPLILIGEDGAKWAAGDNSAFPISGKTWVNNHAHVLRPRRDKVLDDWLIHYLNATDLSDFISGMTVPKLNQGRLREILIPLPPLQEQKRIVVVLDQAFAALDRARTHAEANLADTEELFETYRSTLFTEIFQNAPLRELGAISSRVSVGHVGETSKHYVESGGIPFIRSQNVRPSGLDVENVKKITSVFHRTLKKSQLQGGELLFVRVGANRSDCCAVPTGLGELNCANVVFARPTEGRLAYLENYCQSREGKKALLGMTTGSAQGVINTRSVATLPIPLPDLHQQDLIVSKLEKIRSEQERLQKNYQHHIDDLTNLRQSLLQKAFSGQLT